MHKITLFTSNNTRHNYLINFLSNLCDQLYVVQESKSIFPGLNSNEYTNSKLIYYYFKNVDVAQKKIFGKNLISLKNKINLLPLKMGDLNHIKISDFKGFFQSDLYVVFGSSLIKGNIFNFLKKKKAINIHMGIAPYYRGADCNFWAQYDGNSHLVGSTIHYLSNGIDNGDILSYAKSEFHKNPFIHSMSTVKSAFYCLKKIIYLKRKKSFKQNLNKTIRLSKKKHFKENMINKFLSKIYIQNMHTDKFLLKNSFVLKRKFFFND